MRNLKYEKEFKATQGTKWNVPWTDSVEVKYLKAYIEFSEDLKTKELPDFLDNIDGKIVLTYIGGSDVTEEWNNFIYQKKMDNIDLEHLTNEYLIKKFGSKFGNGNAKQAL